MSYPPQSLHSQRLNGQLNQGGFFNGLKYQQVAPIVNYIVFAERLVN